MMVNNGKNSQGIRTSQFIFNYGPGAIIEGQKSSRIVPDMDRGLGGRIWNSSTMDKYRIENNRLESVIQKKIEGYAGNDYDVRIIRLPTNAEMGMSEDQVLYHTIPFPSWKICYNDAHHSMKIPILYNDASCPECRKKTHSAPVRFVMSCTNGHLDDVAWKFAVHKESNCKGEYFYWKAGGPSLSDIEVICHACKRRVNMKDIYRKHFNCTGKYPEKEQPRGHDHCDKRMKIIQKNSSSIYLPEIVSLLKFPTNNILDVIKSGELENYTFSIEHFPDCNTVIELLENKNIDPNTIKIVKDYCKNHTQQDLVNLMQHKDGNQNFADYFYDEFKNLKSGNFNSDTMIVGKPMFSNISWGKGYETKTGLSIYPVNRLKIDTVHIGYRRMPYKNKDGMDKLKIVYADSLLNNSLYFPGIENTGEGLFITLNNLNIADMPVQDKYAAVNKNDTMSGEWKQLISPLFIWLHTLSHAIMLEISLLDGYSMASTRERVYVNESHTDGGILIYTAIAGGDGSMGGLSGISKSNMDSVLNRAMERITYCSNDPICLESRKTGHNYNGAACYSCLMVSETSCEQRNMYLDRHILLQD